MALISNLLVGLVAAIHFGILVAEMFFWKKPQVHEPLGFNSQEAIQAAPIVANAGLYNGFLAAGLAWSFFATGDAWSLRVFFLLCVLVAGIFGALTLKSWKPLVLQSGAAAAALAAVYIAGSPK